MSRQEAIYELIDTERDYVKDLQVILDVHMRRLRESPSIVQDAQIATIFSNIANIFAVNEVRPTDKFFRRA